MPPAISTFPLVVFPVVPSCTAVCIQRPPVIGFVVPQVWVAGSSRLALASPVVELLPLRPPATNTFPVDRRIATWSWRPSTMVPVAVVQLGSRTAGYATASPSQLTRTVHALAPVAVVRRPHGPAGFLSTAQPSTARTASVRAPRAPTRYGGVTRNRGAPPASKTSNVFATRRSPATRSPSATSYATLAASGGVAKLTKSSTPNGNARCNSVAPDACAAKYTTYPSATCAATARAPFSDTSIATPLAASSR